MAKSLMETSRKPVIFIGGGIIASGAADYLREVVQQTRIPVVRFPYGDWFYGSR
jgi:acetolactate synthase I/II/III large subunit